MRTSAPGTPAHIQTIPADRIARAITFLEGCLLDCETERDTASGQARSFYAGRAGGIALAIAYLREVAK